MAQQFVLGPEMVLGGQLGGAVLKLGGPQAPVPGVVLPVHVGAAAAEGLHLRLHHGGIDAGVGVEGLFNVDDEGLAALFAEGQGDEFLPVKHAAPEDPGLIRHGHHLLGQGQLRHGLAAAVLGEFRLKVRPELPDGRRVPLGADGAELRLRPLLPELFDVVPLAGVPPPGKKLQIFFIVQIVPPGADIAHPHIGIPGQQPGRLFLRHNGDLRQDALFDAVGLDGFQGGVLVPLRACHRVVEGHVPLALAPDDQAASRLRPGVVQGAPPHEFHTGGILAQFIVAVLIIAPQRCRVPRRDAFECQHKTSLTVFFYHTPV